ncbi:hypothetical protein FBU30_006395 [Linnemannia zychae]|nr:hypothetical protein FBU30_006395 [Linnemannia zychae]
MRARDEGLATVNGELSAGVCFFLARCFNVMHTMPDTALESVVWMDVTPRDVVLLVTMIELRDIMVDERYWRRGYWKIDRPCISSTDTDEVYDVDDVDDEGDWDGFYYLINQEGTERSVSLPRNRSSVTFSSEVGRHSRRNASTIRGLGANSSFNARSSSESASRSPTTTTVAGTASFSRLTIAPLPTELSVSEHFAQLVRNASSSLTTASNHLTSPASALLKQSKIYRDIPAPEPWQGFGDGISESSPQKVFPTDELPPAVQLFESLKTEIDDIAAAARSCGKGKKPSLTGHASNPWRH